MWYLEKGNNFWWLCCDYHGKVSHFYVQAWEIKKGASSGADTHRKSLKWKGVVLQLCCQLKMYPDCINVLSHSSWSLGFYSSALLPVSFWQHHHHTAVMCHRNKYRSGEQCNLKRDNCKNWFCWLFIKSHNKPQTTAKFNTIFKSVISTTAYAWRLSNELLEWATVPPCVQGLFSLA